MKRLITTCLFCIITTLAMGQATFQKIIGEGKNLYLYSVIEIPDGYVLNAAVGRYGLTKVKAQLFKIDKYGETVYDKVIPTNSYIFMINQMIRLENENYLCFGQQKLILDSTSLFTVLMLDKNFNTIWEKTYQTPFYDMDYYNYEYFNSDILVIGCGRKTNNTFYQNFAYRINTAGDTMSSKIYPFSGLNIAFDILPIIGAAAFKVFTFGYHQQTNTPGQIIFIDTLLEMTAIKGIPERVYLYNDAKYIDESHYLLTGKKTIENSHPQDDQLAIMIMDTSDVMIDLKYFGAADTSDYPSLYKNLSFIDTDNIYFGGTKNLSPLYFPTTPSWFVINNLNSNLEIKWQKYYGGDAYYLMWSMIATIDGGCLMAGTRYDYIAQPEAKDIILIKIDSNGLVTGLNDESLPIPVREAIVYPNPASTLVTVEFSLAYQQAELQLTDISGKTVLKTQLTSNRQTIDISAIQAGTYIYRIYNQKGLEETGKLLVKYY